MKNLANSRQDTQNQFIFAAEHTEKRRDKNKNSKTDLIYLTPYGLSLTTDSQRPVLLLRDEKSGQVLPVSLNPLEAAVTLSQSNHNVTPVTPHRVSEILLQSLKIKIQRCVFVEIKGPHQYVRLYLQNNPSEKSLKLRADEAMSLCLHLSVEIYATQELMNKSRVMSAKLEEPGQALQMQGNALLKTHEYLM